MQPSNELQQWELIEAYCQGKLKPHQQAAFEQRLENDPDLRQITDDFGRGDRAIRMAVLEPVVQKAIQRELRHSAPVRVEPQRTTPIWRIRLKRVAGVVAVAALCFVSYLSFVQVDLRDYRDDVTLTYRYRDMDNATSPPDFTPQQRAFYRSFFDAQAHLANGQPRLAIPNLEALARNDNLRPYFRQAVYWHLLNAYLLDDQSDNAEATLKLLDQTTLVYPIDPMDRWKVWCQINLKKLH